jgi:hypothetical protein
MNIDYTPLNPPLTGRKSGNLIPSLEKGRKSGNLVPSPFKGEG